MANDKYEQQCWAAGLVVAGIDEAGYGCLAGSLFTAGVILPSGFDFSELPDLNDSKQLTQGQRFKLEPKIKKLATHWFVCEATAAEVDEENAYWLRFRLAEDYINKHRAELPAGLVCIMDGNQALRVNGIDSQCLIKGDTLCFSIAAASVLAKCAKDRQMIMLDKDFPQYGWASNKGYGSPGHKDAISKHGFTPHHRRKYCKNIKIGA